MKKVILTVLICLFATIGWAQEKTVWSYTIKQVYKMLTDYVVVVMINADGREFSGKEIKINYGENKDLTSLQLQEKITEQVKYIIENCGVKEDLVITKQVASIEGQTIAVSIK